MIDHPPAQRSEAAEEEFIVYFFRSFQMIKLYEDNNKLVQRSFVQLRERAGNVLTEADLTVVILEGSYYIQGRRFRYRRVGRFVRSLLDEFAERGLLGFTFHPNFLKTPTEELIRFFRYVIWLVGMENPEERLTRQTNSREFAWVELLDQSRANAIINDRRLKMLERAQQVYQRSLSSVKEISRRTSRGAKAGILRARHVVQGMVELVQEDDSLLQSLAAIKDYDDYTFVHSVNVSVLSVCLGNRIGLSRPELTHLGICGLFHDLGKVEILPEIIKKPGKLDDAEWVQMQKHPLGSMRQILRLDTTHVIKSKVFLAPLEHHLNYDLSGYPRIKSKIKVSLFGRILKISDVYDAITSPRVYRQYNYSPEQTIRMLKAKSGKEFDPILLKVFIGMMGKYPIGTLLVLDSDEMGLVVRNVEDRPERPSEVMLLKKSSGGEFAQGEIVDLNEKDSKKGGVFKRNVLRSFHPAVIGIQPAQFILQHTIPAPN